MVRLFYCWSRDKISNILSLRPRIIAVHKTLFRSNNSGNLWFLPYPWCIARHKKRGCVSTGEGGDSGRQFEELLLDRDIGVEKDR